MRRNIVSAVLGISMIAPPAYGQSPLQGEWKITVPDSPGYVGAVKVDADKRATLTAAMDNGRPANYRGYVARTTATNAEIILTDGVDVAKAYCSILSSDLLHCRNIRGNETLGDPYVLTRLKQDIGKLWKSP